MKRSKLQRLEIYVEPSIAKALSGLAEGDDRTLSNYVARVLAEHVTEYVSGQRKRKDS